MKYVVGIIILILLGVSVYLYSQRNNLESDVDIIHNNSKTSMTFTSSAFNNNERIPAKYTCDGENISPALHIEDVPEGAKSLALIMHDPDAPREGGWTHWTMWNINPVTTDIPDSSVPDGVTEGDTSSGKPGYGGPCPPSGTHRYFFYLYALDDVLDIPASSGKAELEEAMKGHVTGETSLMGTYSRE
jgi:Raf kinase inhibitor-like YbhB/YbcL family protein